MPTIDVLDSTIHYEDRGAGVPIVFLHGNPTSSHLWRNVLPGVGTPGRLLAPDLIGMGQSGKPEIDYTFADHAHYLEAFLDALSLGDLVLVGHDWGGALAFDWATRHPGRTRGIAFFETIVRPMSWEREYAGRARTRMEALRAPGSGETKVLHENFFMTVALEATVLSGLSETDAAVYRDPYPTPESRRPLLAWPRSLPIDGEPADVTARVVAYDRWLAATPEVPKLLLTFDGPSQTLIVDEELTAWCREHIAGLEVEVCGLAAHLAPEDQPDAIGAAIGRWFDRHALR